MIKMIITQDKVLAALEIGKEYIVGDVVQLLCPDEDFDNYVIKVRKKLRILAHLGFLERRYLYGKEYRNSIYKRVK